jgi:hypothetical protein
MTKTAVNSEAKPIQVKMVSFPKVWMLARRAVQIAATRVQTTVQTLWLERALNPCARPIKPAPDASLVNVSYWYYFGSVEAEWLFTYVQATMNNPPATSRRTGPPTLPAASAML